MTRTGCVDELTAAEQWAARIDKARQLAAQLRGAEEAKSSIGTTR